MSMVQPPRHLHRARPSPRPEHLASGALPEDIHRSRLRCQQLGLQAPDRLPLDMLRPCPSSMQSEHGQILLQQVQAELRMLADAAARQGGVAVLSNHEGWILHTDGSVDFLQRAAGLALQPGTCWNEATAGTNAIGTAIAEGRTVAVQGREHYFSSHRQLNCVASPIFNPYGAMIGVLDISNHAGLPQAYAPGLLKLAIAQIEHRHFRADITDADVLQLHVDPAWLGTPYEGLLAFREGRLHAANRFALKLLGLDRHAMGRHTYEALFDQPLTALMHDGRLRDQRGQYLHGRIVARPGLGSTHRAARRAGEQPAVASNPDILLNDSLQHELTCAGKLLEAGLPVLLQGETGSGKEVLARELHRRSPRADKPFIAINCAALPESLIEAELFGYEDGAFTGARRKGSPGLLRQADGGTLFLDEIGDMPIALQPRLLRVLQERELVPLGGGKPVQLDFLLICATHRDLQSAISAGQFRADLYYRVAHYSLCIPPVRATTDRRQLVQQLWRRLGRGHLADATLTALANFDWPGNLRQLSACLRSLAALHQPDDLIQIGALPAQIHQATKPEPTPGAAPSDRPAPSSSLGEGLHTLTDQLIRQTLRNCDGNISRAARQLGISRSTLYRRGLLAADDSSPAA